MTASPRIREVLARLEETRWKYYNLHPASGEILALLARVSRAQQMIEVGTSNGYSSIILGSAVQPHGGAVTTIERNADVAEEARENIAAAGLQDVVTVVSGSAYKALRDLPGPWDFAFLDATKQEYVGYLDRILPKLASPALLVADNMLSHEDELAEFRERVAAEPRLDATILPIGTGLLVGIYHPEEVLEPAEALARVAATVTTAARHPA